MRLLPLSTTGYSPALHTMARAWPAGIGMPEVLTAKSRPVSSILS